MNIKTVLAIVLIAFTAGVGVWLHLRKKNKK